MQIVIPTHGRPNKQTTLLSIPESMREDVLLVVSTTEDYDSIRRWHKNTKLAQVNSIADKRQWIMENVKAKKIFMLDDDLGFQGRCPSKYRVYDGRWKLLDPAHNLLAKRYATPKAIEKMFITLSNKLDDFAHAGLSSRMGNDTAPASWLYNARMMHAIGYDRAAFHKAKARFNDVQCREDFHVTLTLLRKGLGNAVYYDYCCSPGPYGAAGGASLERTVALSDREAEKLADLHPGFVRVLEKEYKNIPRKEVMIYWKKAYEDGQNR